MVGKMSHSGITACNNCTKNYSIYDKKQRGISSISFRFFKIMHGEDCSDVMYLPPKFARHVRHLSGQRTQIEDSDGNKWTIKISYVDGVLAFQEGWHKFFEDHQLEYGEIVVFNYMKEGSFIVQIYGLSACEKINFNRRNDQPNKRKQRDQAVIPDEPSHEIAASSPDETSSASLVSSGINIKNFENHPKKIRSASCLGKLPVSLAPKSMDDPSCILQRDFGCYKGEDRGFLFDLSSFEMGNNSFDSCKHKTRLDRTVSSVEPQAREQVKARESDTQSSMACKNLKTRLDRTVSPVEPQAREPVKARESDTQSSMACKNHCDDLSCGIFSDALDSKLSYNSDSRKDFPGNASKFEAVGNNCVLPSHIQSPSIASCQLADNEDALNTKLCNSSVSTSMLKYPIGEKSAVAKKELSESEAEAYIYPQVPFGNSSTTIPTFSLTPSTVKAEPDMCDDFVSVISDIFSVEVKSQSFLELPFSTPAFPWRRGKVVYLRDSSERLWPVLFPNTSVLKAITAGWSTFCEANNIMVGDECTLRVESNVPGIYKVDVSHKAS